MPHSWVVVSCIMTSTEWFDRVFGLLVHPDVVEELARRKEQFFVRTGTPHPEEASYEARMQAFGEWVLLDPPEPGKRPWLVSLLDRGMLSGELMAYARSLLASQTGLFVLMSPWRKTAWVRDLIGGADFHVTARIPVDGLEPGQIMQTRIFVHDGSVGVTDGMIVHPVFATEIIHQRVREMQTRDVPTMDILHLMAKLAWRASCYPRHAPEVFYDFDNPLVQDVVLSVFRR